MQIPTSLRCRFDVASMHEVRLLGLQCLLPRRCLAAVLILSASSTNIAWDEAHSSSVYALNRGLPLQLVAPVVCCQLGSTFMQNRRA